MDWKNDHSMLFSLPCDYTEHAWGRFLYLTLVQAYLGLLSSNSFWMHMVNYFARNSFFIQFLHHESKFSDGSLLMFLLFFFPLGSFVDLLAVYWLKRAAQQTSNTR